MEPDSSADSGSAGGAPGRILVVDDDAVFLEPLCDILSAAGYKARGLTSAREALDALKTGTYDLLLADLMMPEMDGVSLLKAALEADPCLVGILMTGEGSVPTAVDAMKVGAFDYLVKPLEYRMLPPLLSRAMEVRRLKTENVHLREAVEVAELRQALQESEKNFRSFMDHLPGVAFMKDPEGRYLFINQAWERFFGLGPDDVLGKTDRKLWAPEIAEQFIANDRVVIEQKRPVENIETVPHKDGLHDWLAVKFPLQDGKDEPFMIGGIAIDVTGRRAMEEELRTAKERLQALSRCLLAIQERERRNLARELHDEIGQALTVVNLNLRTALSLCGVQAAAAQIEKTISSVGEALGRVRDISLDLRPSLLDDLGLVPALRWYINRLSQTSGLPIRFVERGLTERLPAEIETACFRVAQEALTNALRHANAQEVSVDLFLNGGELILTVRDNGSGFDVSSKEKRAARGESFGLLGMRERALLAGGSVEIRSAFRQGTEVAARFPVEEA